MKKKHSFTLLETIVTVMIYAFLLLMITNIVLINARLSEKLKIRSRVRSELTQVTSLIKRDIRNADTISYTNCTGTTCQMSVQNHVIIWRYDSTNKAVQKTQDGVSEYISATYVSVDSISFSIIPDQDPLSKRATVILTVKAQGKNAVWNVTNQVLQEIISTRNYELSL